MMPKDNAGYGGIGEGLLCSLQRTDWKLLQSNKQCQGVHVVRLKLESSVFVNLSIDSTNDPGR